MTIKIIRKNTSTVKVLASERSRGFSMVEMLIAIAVLIIAVVNPITLVGGSLQQIYFSRDEVAAVNLAQEGIEAVRQLRDTHMLSGVNWLNGGAADTRITPAGIFTVETGLSTLTHPSLTSCTGACTGKLYVYTDNGTSVYSHTVSTTPSVFSRKITVDAGCSPAGVECKVTSTVTWKTGNLPGSVAVTDYIYNWTQ